MEDVISGLRDWTIGQIPIYLLKTQSNPEDAYREHFEQSNASTYKPFFIPVLDHIFRDDALRTLRRSAERFAFAGGSKADGRRKATNNPAKKYGALVFTSQRAVDAFSIVVAKLNPNKFRVFFDPDMPIYVVGPATARGVRHLELPCPVVGEQTGNGEALAQHILEWHKTLSPEVTHLDGQKLPLLFLVGEQRRDTIPKALLSDDVPEADQIPVVELVVYETGEMAAFEEFFTDLVQEAKAAKIGEQWIVVFSPQGCEAMLNALGWLDEKSGKFSQARRDALSGPMKTGIATIGPTTRDFLVQEFGFEPEVCAAEPTPEGVRSGIESFRRK